jgi:excisionase family DNA binding protein
MAERQQFDVVPESSLSEAAEILTVDRRTVKKLIKQGILPARIAGPPTSQRPRYRIPTEEVLQLRNSYGRPSKPCSGKRKKITHRKPTNTFSHIKLKLG